MAAKRWRRYAALAGGARSNNGPHAASRAPRAILPHRREIGGDEAHLEENNALRREEIVVLCSCVDVGRACARAEERHTMKIKADAIFSKNA